MEAETWDMVSKLRLHAYIYILNVLSCLQMFYLKITVYCRTSGNIDNGLWRCTKHAAFNVCYFIMKLFFKPSSTMSVLWCVICSSFSHYLHANIMWSENIWNRISYFNIEFYNNERLLVLSLQIYPFMIEQNQSRGNW